MGFFLDEKLACMDLMFNILINQNNYYVDISVEEELKSGELEHRKKKKKRN